MKTITVEDIYKKLEPIFEEIESPYERRLKVYILLNNLLPKWEGNEQLNNPTSNALDIDGVSILLPTENDAVAISEINNEMTAQEKAFFVAGFKECIKFLNLKSNKR